MNSRTGGIIATIAAVVLCGCPGLFLCVFGAAMAAGAPINTEMNGVSQTLPPSPATGVGLLCVALIFILIPILVGFFTLRKKAEVTPAPPMPPMPPAPPSEPLPPTS
jgi:hypothetical protein